MSSGGSSSQIPLSDLNMGQGSNPGGNNYKYGINYINDKNWDTDNLASFLEQYRGQRIRDSGIRMNYSEAELNNRTYVSNVYRYIVDQGFVRLDLSMTITGNRIESIRALHLNIPK